MEQFDLVVIGAGPGGYPAAIRAAQLGTSVAIVEKEALGGTCLNWGCIPTKTLIASSSLYRRMQGANELGVSASELTFDYAAMADRKNKVVTKLTSGVELLLKGNGVKLFRGTASFTGHRKLEVKSDSGNTVLEARRIIIATGSVSSMPGFIPKHNRVVESRAFLELTSLPKSMIVLGGGVIGCEFACMAAQLGVKVTVVEMLEDVLLILDPDVRRELRRNMEKNLAITILTGKPLENIKANSNSVSGTVDGKSISADMLLVSVGRRPFTEGLALEKTGLTTTKSGHIEINDYLQTAVSGIFAIGDVTADSTQLAHAATAEGIIAAENALTPKLRKKDALVPACIFTDPEIGAVGITEQKAREQGLDVVSGRFSFAALGKALASGETSGFVKWVADATTGQLLGAQCVGAHATELISEAAVAIRSELTVAELGNVIHCHPTMSESWMEAVHAMDGRGIHSPPKRKR